MSPLFWIGFFRERCTFDSKLPWASSAMLCDQISEEGGKRQIGTDSPRTGTDRQTDDRGPDAARRVVSVAILPWATQRSHCLTTQWPQALNGRLSIMAGAWQRSPLSLVKWSVITVSSLLSCLGPALVIRGTSQGGCGLQMIRPRDSAS